MAAATKKPAFFPSPSDFHAWLDANHARAAELLVGFYKKDSGKPSITWPESVDVALCFGWIDGVRRRIDEVSYSIRFTPRRPRSAWSAINIERVRKLTKLGRMRPAGLAAFEKRLEEKSVIYSYEQRKSAKFSREFEHQFRARKKAWDFFRAQAPSYQRLATHWVTSAKKDETRRKRFARLLEDSAHSRRLRESLPPR